MGLYLHVSGAIFALALGPFQFVEGIRLRHASLHRGLGWTYLVFGVLIGGLAGLYKSQFAHGGVPGRLGFGALAFDAIRRREVAEHRRWMIRNYALPYAAVMLPLYLPAAVVAGADFALAYGVIAWACWVPNWLFAEWLLRMRVELRQA